MAKGKLSLFKIGLKTQALFYLLPLAVFLLAVLPVESMVNPHEFLAMFAFWFIVFPAAALMQPIGSLEQQELFISFPISPWKMAIFYPLLMDVVYGGLFELVLSISGKTIGGAILVQTQIRASFSAIIFLFFLTIMLISLFKNSAVGLCLSIFYVLFGMFTGGAGQGPFYLLQWFRPRAESGAADYVLDQYSGAAFLCLLTFLLVKYRERFYLLKL